MPLWLGGGGPLSTPLSDSENESDKFTPVTVTDLPPVLLDEALFGTNRSLSEKGLGGESGFPLPIVPLLDTTEDTIYPGVYTVVLSDSEKVKRLAYFRCVVDSPFIDEACISCSALGTHSESIGIPSLNAR